MPNIVHKRGLWAVAHMWYNVCGDQVFSSTLQAGFIPENPPGVDYANKLDVIKASISIRSRHMIRHYLCGEPTSPGISTYIEGKQALPKHPTRRIWPLPIVVAMVVGFLRALWESRRRRVYLYTVGWSCLTWLPLLLTRGVTGLRSSVGLPADVFFVGLGAVTFIDPIRTVVAKRYHWILFLLFWGFMLGGGLRQCPVLFLRAAGPSRGGGKKRMLGSRVEPIGYRVGGSCRETKTLIDPWQYVLRPCSLLATAL